MAMTCGRQAVRLLLAIAAVCAVLGGGCAESRIPRIDPTGERLFVASPEPAHPHIKNVPGPPHPWDTVELILTPRNTIAPVGSEVVLLAAVRGPDNYLRTNERVEWQIASGGVGEFVDFEHGTFHDFLVGDFTRPRKVNGTYVIGSTSRRYLRLTRGTPTPADDVTVLRGQTWVSVTSPVEGTSQVTAFSPDVYGWEARKHTAMIHWVDAQWRFPPPAINPAGSRHVFTTLVMRHTDQAPCVGWRVQYTIADGPPAGFSPSGAPSVEVETNAAGQASAEIFQQQPTPGTNRIAIQVIRPPQAGGPGGARLVVGSGFTSKTWSAPGLSLRKTGPAVGSVGAALTYRIELANSGDMPADGIVLTDEVPEEVSVMSTNPPGQSSGRALQWQVGRLGPAERRVFEVNFRADRPGSITTCAEAVAAGGLRAKQCVTTSIALAVPPTATAPGPGCVGPSVAAAGVLDVRILGPDRVNVGDTATFEIVITNRGASTATGIVIKDRFDAGLVHERLSSPIRRLLGEDLPPGQSKRIGVELRAVQAGRLCQSVEVTGNGGIVASAEACVTAVERGAAGPPAAAGPLSVKVTGPSSAAVGEDVDFFIELGNDGYRPLTNLKVSSEFDLALDPKGAREPVAGYEGDALYWTMASLSPGQKKTYQVRCVCSKEAARACIRVTVTAAEAAVAPQVACLAIRAQAAAPSSGLSLTVSALHEPVAVGKELTYVIRVTNNGRTDDEQVVVKATVPSQMLPARLGTTGPSRANFDGQTVTFDPVERIAAGGVLTYRIRVQAKQTGDARLQAEVTSRAQRQPILSEARTTIVGGQ
jgi:uncharacterized repeat protein (TIGR01451 family)